MKEIDIPKTKGCFLCKAFVMPYACSPCRNDYKNKHKEVKQNE